jgi:hypothetical protein
MTKLKGLSVLQCREYIRARFGEDGLRRTRAAMSPEARARVYADDMLATDWLEVAHGLDHLDAFDRALGSGDGRSGALMIRDLTAQHFSGTYRATLAVATTPLNVLERSSRLWSRIYDRGESLIDIHSPTSVSKRIIDCPDLPRGHDRLTSPYYEELLRQCGAKNIVCDHTACVGRGAPQCVTKIHWE